MELGEKRVSEVERIKKSGLDKRNEVARRKSERLRRRNE